MEEQMRWKWKSLALWRGGGGHQHLRASGNHKSTSLDPRKVSQSGRVSVLPTLFCAQNAPNRYSIIRALLPLGRPLYILLLIS
jgi:hypothetical protein